MFCNSCIVQYFSGSLSFPTLQRTHVLQWVAAVSLDLGAKHLPTYLPSLLPPLHRELADPSHTAGKDLFSLAQEVLELVRGICGKEAFSQAYAQHQKAVTAAREKRHGQAALEVGVAYIFHLWGSY